MPVPLKGSIRVVSDKSLTHRGVLVGALARGRTVLDDPNPGEDCQATLRAVEALGIAVSRSGSSWILEGGGLEEPGDVLDLGNSGTGMRLLAGLLSAFPFHAVLTGDASLRSRPMARVIEPLRRMGARIEARAGGRAPLSVRGGGLSGIEWDAPVASAQVKSALLLAGLGGSGGQIRYREPAPSRDHTERLLSWLGADLHREGRDLVMPCGQSLRARSWRVPGDISAAAFYLVAGAAVPGSHVTVEHVGLNPTRAGILRALERMGADLEIVESPEDGPEPAGAVTVRGSELRPVEIGGGEVPTLIDEIPVLAVAAACASGESRFRDVGELRVKESDRIAAVCGMLAALGVETAEERDSFVVRGTGRIGGGLVESRGDHRIAMAARIADCISSRRVEVDSTRMIATSDPGFESRLARLLGGDS